MMLKHIFLVGSNGIPAAYGGFETFVEQLVLHKSRPDIRYHVACLCDKKKEYEYHGAHCFGIAVPDLGPAKAPYYDNKALHFCCSYIEKEKIEGAVVYVLGYGIGPFFGHYQRRLHKLGAQLFINPDGLEWKREKWSPLIQKYFRYAEKQTMKHGDLVICDAQGIEEHLRTSYPTLPTKTHFIAYGATVQPGALDPQSDKVRDWYAQKGVAEGGYYLVVGRFVPENNYRTMLLEFMKSSTDKSLVLITNVEQNPFYERLRAETHFDQDKRIKFVGTVYDQELLTYIRRHAFAYIHGHEVGGTNPSLLEALACTPLNLLLNVNFNREVGGNGALYWGKEDGALAGLITQCDRMLPDEAADYEEKAKKRISDYYNWGTICTQYETIFTQDVNPHDKHQES